MSTLTRPSAAVESVPPLKHGDRLTREEFERRYEAMPHVKKAELIEGVVYMPSPVRTEGHAHEDNLLSTCIGIYHLQTPGTLAANNATTKLDLANVPQPDCLLMILPKCGGSAQIDADGYVVNAPELVAEIAASSASIDLGTKLNVYRRNGVCEYIVWRVLDRALDWFVLRDGEFKPMPASAEGILKSECFPGFWIDPRALVAGDGERIWDALLQGIASPEHTAFVARLNPKP